MSCAIGFLPVEQQQLDGVLVPVAENERVPVGSVPVADAYFFACVLISFYSARFMILPCIVPYQLCVVNHLPGIRREPHARETMLPSNVQLEILPRRVCRGLGWVNVLHPSLPFSVPSWSCGW